jgi:hypothetical protein
VSSSYLATTTVVVAWVATCSETLPWSARETTASGSGCVGPLAATNAERHVHPGGTALIPRPADCEHELDVANQRI